MKITKGTNFKPCDEKEPKEHHKDLDKDDCWHDCRHHCRCCCCCCKGDKGDKGDGGSCYGTIIPFCSSNYVLMGTNHLGKRNGLCAMGFGYARYIESPDDPIDFEKMGNSFCDQFAFSMPEHGRITSMSAYFSSNEKNDSTTDVILNSRVILRVIRQQQFHACSRRENCNGAIVPGEPTYFKRRGLLSNISIPVAAEARLMLVLYMESPPTVSSMRGAVGGGLRIEAQ